MQTRVTVAFPFGTFGGNLIGCFLMGLIFALVSRGALGGSTTYSAFSLESVFMLQTEQYGQAVLYMLASVQWGYWLHLPGYGWSSWHSRSA
ncbi:fluoride efflux transporter FluC [Pontibacter sp. HJ8]